MKIIFDRQKISNDMLPLMCAISGKAGLSATEGILMEAGENGELVMTTFDLEKGMRISVEADIREPGSYIINAQKFLQVMRVMDSDEVIMTVDEKKTVTLSNMSGSSTYKMTALAPEDFPKIPRLVTEKSFVISQSVLSHILSKIVHAVATNDQRPVLNGCYFEIKDNRLLAVSCDSFKLAKCVAEVEIENTNTDGGTVDFTFNIPVKTVQELIRQLSDKEDDKVKVYVSYKNIVFEFGDRIFFSRLIDGMYIDYDRIIMKNHKIAVEVDKDIILSALERASLVTEERVAGSLRSYVKLDLAEGQMRISAISTQGSTYEEIDVDKNGDDLAIAFNNRYLIDSIKACSGDRIKISLSSPLSGVNIEPADGCETEDGDVVKGQLFMLLPVKMRE